MYKRIVDIMTEPDLSFIKSDIDLSEVAPLNRRRVVAFVNCYILRMTDFLNDFANRAERLILESERQLHAVDIKLQLLEAKLAGIPDPGPKQQDSLKSSSGDNTKVSAASEFNVNAPSAHLRTDMPSSSQQSAAPAPEAAAATVQPPAAASAEAAAVEQQNVLLVKDDPAFAKYFKMLKLNSSATQQQTNRATMQSSLCPCPRKPRVVPLLSTSVCSSLTPNAPSPNSAKASDPMNSALSQADDSDSSSVSSFSDSD
ncbi:hypothetical protein Y032_0076g1031 [Ancylostoma ceylanicum]|uniref:Uncharacterized protein n=1 Tax=Ancylostoma ceylanicum TaxID=53326 RepID=A0A016TVH8_9BILA|nr:hypothetical protein Y032_0076g1031 [Ancylostoma ceylanicum]